MRKHMLGMGTALLVVFAVACGGSKKNTATPDETGDSDEEYTGDPCGGDPCAEENPCALGEEDNAIDELNRCFAKKRPSVARCYSAAVESGKLDKKAKGRITVEMVISPSGKPTKVRFTQNTLRSPDLEQCVQATIEGWVIPAPGVATEFSFSYDFEPE